MSGLYPLDVSSMPSSRCDNQKCFQILPNVPQKAKLHLVANHWFRTAGGPKCSPLDLLSLCSQGARAHVVSHSVMSHFVTPWTVALQVPLSIGLSKQNTGVGCHFLLQGIFLTQGSNLHLLDFQHWQADSLPLSFLGSLGSTTASNYDSRVSNVLTEFWFASWRAVFCEWHYATVLWI